MQAFRDALTTEFEDRLFAHLRQKLAQSGVLLSPEAIREGIQTGVCVAKEFGLAREIDVVRYVEIVFLHLGGFTGGEHPVRAMQILYAWGVDPSEKLDRFEKWAVAQGARQ